MVEHPPPSCLEVVDTKKQPDSTCVLAADGVDLSLAVGLSQQQPGLRLRRSDDDPTLRTSLVRGRRRVFNEVESQCVDEESDGVVVVLDNQRGVLDVHTPTVRGPRVAAALPAGSHETDPSPPSVEVMLPDC